MRGEITRAIEDLFFAEKRIMPIVTLRNTDYGCEVWAQRDAAEDVAGHLREQRLFVDGPISDIRTNMKLLSVRMPVGDLLCAEHVRRLLIAIPDFNVVDWAMAMDR